VSKNDFVPMTLAQKKRIIFKRNSALPTYRYGFTSDLAMKTPGDLSTALFNDTIMDGLLDIHVFWSLAGELFRFMPLTKSEDAQFKIAYEAFEAMERLTRTSRLKRFPASFWKRRL